MTIGAGIAIGFISFMLLGLFFNALDSAAYSRSLKRSEELRKHDPNVIHLEMKDGKAVWTDWQGKVLN